MIEKSAKMLKSTMSKFVLERTLRNFYWSEPNRLSKLKFTYSEKTTNFAKSPPNVLCLRNVEKSKVEISQNFVAFSEYTNFMSYQISQNFVTYQHELVDAQFTRPWHKFSIAPHLSHRNVTKNPSIVHTFPNILEFY